MIRAIPATGKNKIFKKKFVHSPASFTVFCLDRVTVGWRHTQQPWGQRQGKALTRCQLAGLTHRTIHSKGQFKVPNLLTAQISFNLYSNRKVH